MSDRDQERHYRIGGLNVWFGIGSILLLVVLGWAFMQDYAREWKRYQREFRTIDQQVTRAEFQEARQALEGSADYQQALAAVAQAEEDLDSLGGQVRDAQALVRQQELRAQIVATRYQIDQARYDVAVFQYQQALAGEGSDVQPAQERLSQRRVTLGTSELANQETETALANAQQQLESLRADLTHAQRRLSSVAQEDQLIQRRLVALDPEFMSLGNRLATAVRNLPVIDLSQPSLKIRQVVLAGITEDLNFAQVPRVDRCVTCHVGTTRDDLTDQPIPFGSHPSLELFLSPDSPHPLEEFGCTTCHAGRGRATDFYGAAHSPQDEEQRREWEQAHAWREYELWEAPMQPLQYAEAGCYQCHSGQTSVPGADALNFGLQLVEQSGCYSCHLIESLADRPKRGPNLALVADKLSREFVYNWIKDPAGFRPATWMPSYFGQTNNDDPEQAAWTDQEIHSIVTYLFSNSSDYQQDPLPVQGNAVRGEGLVASIGCLACHQLPEEADQKAQDANVLRRQFGPSFTGVGTKTGQQWLYNWIKDPTSYHELTRMPNLRVSDQEAADISAYLIGFTQPSFLRPVPQVDASVVDQIALQYLNKSRTQQDAANQLAGMSLTDKLEYSGQRLISQYGCFACHNIPGFEDARPIGTELTAIGLKPLHQFDFGFIDLEHSRQDWWEQKLADPRIFDEFRVRAPDQRLRMPNFHFSEHQIEGVVTALSGFVGVDPGNSRIVPRTPRNLALEAGQSLVRENNCQACHLIEGEGQAIAPTINRWLIDFQGRSPAEASGQVLAYTPPDLVGEGAKVQSQWLFDFLHQPSPIRPWLQVRMPSYGFSAEEINTIARYFSALDEAEFPFVDRVEVALTAAELGAAGQMFSRQVFDCTTCHIQGSQLPAGTPDRWAPDFARANARLRPQWIIDWIRDPQGLSPGTRMPTFFPEDIFDDAGPPNILGGDEVEQIRVMRDYILSLGQ